MFSQSTNRWRCSTGCAALAAAALCAMMFTASPTASRLQQARGAAPPAAGGEKCTVLITGANRGLGLEFAKQYHQAGWNVIATARDPDAADDLKSIEKSSAAGAAARTLRIEQLDVADSKSVAALAERLKGEPIDLLINNAGISGAGSRVSEIEIEEFERVLQVNALGPVRVTRSLLPNLKAGKGKTIVNITSGLGSIEQNRGGGFYGYRESKAALNMFTRSCAAELENDGFTCIVMSPGWVQTDMGGPGAQLTPEQSISGMRKVIDALKPEDTGKFWNYDGKTMPW